MAASRLRPRAKRSTPQGMCDAIAEVVKRLGTLSEEEKAGLEYSFSEIFAGQKRQQQPRLEFGELTPLRLDSRCSSQESSRYQGCGTPRQAQAQLDSRCSSATNYE